MIDLLKQLLNTYNTNEEKYNRLREYLQMFILKILDEQGFFQQIAFVGGTALRIIYDLKRFSEDLYFSLVSQKNYSFSFEKIGTAIERRFHLENLSVSIKSNHDKTVASAQIKFENLLYELGLSKLKNQKLMIKLEIDQNPPEGANMQFSIINKNLLVGINHYDLPSLFSGKLHAVLSRKYDKGRDYYDLIWYIGKKVQPNYAFLNKAILQSQGGNKKIDNEKLIALLKEKIATLNIKQIKNDLMPFIENPHELAYLEPSKLTQLVDSIK